ncbi:MAG: hypothetical protein V4671_33545 [Armatimonadota bacterium]
MNDVENCLELLSVTTLRNRLNSSGPLTLSEASVIIDRVAELLDGIHLNNQVYGAVKPENILLLPGGQVQLLASTGPAARPTGEQSGRTFVGDSLYLSPEEVRGEPATAATDIWCLGALLYEMLTGFPPFVALRLYMLREMVSHQEPDLLGKSAAPAQIVVDRALAKWPANRFVSAQEFANILWAVAPSPQAAAVTAVKSASPQTAQPAVSLLQAVNRPLILTPPASKNTGDQISAPRGWMRFFSGRRQVSSRAVA